MRLERKDSAKFAKSKLLASYNDIDIYIEDTARNYEKIYVNIFQRVFNGKYQINNVFPIGSRGRVINKCQTNSTKISRPTLYLVDGDLYIMKGENKLPPGIYRLPAYCIENILLDINAIIDYINEEHPALRKEQIISSFSYENWKVTCKDPLVDLFIIYAVIQKLNIPNLPNVSTPVSDFMPQVDDTIIDSHIVRNKITDLERVIISTVTEDVYQKTKIEIISVLDPSLCHLMTYVSGKDYLYPLLYKKASNVLNKSISHINFKQRLAMKCDVSRLMNCHSDVLTP